MALVIVGKKVSITKSKQQWVPKQKPTEEATKPKDPQAWIPVQSRRKRTSTSGTTTPIAVTIDSPTNPRPEVEKSVRVEQQAHGRLPSEHG